MNRNIRIDKGIANKDAMDFSWLLDAPAGKHGFVEVKQGNLYYENGKRAKFVGFNFPARANMPDHKTAEQISRRLATMGVNVVRLHAVDAPISKKRGWSTNPDSPLIDYNSGTSRIFCDEGLDRFDYWVSKLKEQGIYLHVDLLVGRAFMDGDDLDYPDSPPFHIKSITHLNQRLIDLQKEFATQYLCHENKYTGMALIDDPAVMTIQIVNENSIFYDTAFARRFEGIKPYKDEMQRRFNHFLLAKYETRKNLAEAWTFEGKCALGEDEDPAKGTVKCIEIGDYYQPMNDPMGDWMAQDGPARYSDFAEFGIFINRKYYREMIDHIRSLGAKVPIATTNLLTGAADIFSASDGDIMENNAYFNHPAPSRELIIPDMREYVSSDPRLFTFPGFERRSNLTAQASCAAIKDKPFILSEWNEYGAYPFHSSAFIMTAAYACLNNWDGLIVYCYHTSDMVDDQPGDEIRNIMDAFNDPSLVLQFGNMSALFLNGLVSEAKNEVDIIHTDNDLLTQPKAHRMPNSFLPFISKIRTVFLNSGEIYNGSADVAISGGALSGGDYKNAEHAVIYAHSPYIDAKRHYFAGDSHLRKYVDGASKDLSGIGLLNDKFLVFENIAELCKDGNYTAVAKATDYALKKWSMLDTDCGIVGDLMISDTHELEFDPKNEYFKIDTPDFAFYSGKPYESIELGIRYSANANNERITMSLLPLDGSNVAESKHLLFTAIGKTGMDQTEYEKIEDSLDIKMHLKGKLYIDTLEGGLWIKECKSAQLWALDVYGNKIAEIKPGIKEDGCVFEFDGSLPAGNYELIVD
jgi:hypothetical protein